MLDPQPPLMERLVGQVLLQGQLRTAGLLRRHQDLSLGERARQEAQILHQPTPGWQWGGGDLRACLKSGLCGKISPLGTCCGGHGMSQRYPTDLTEAEWAILAPLIPAAKCG